MSHSTLFSELCLFYTKYRIPKNTKHFQNPKNFRTLTLMEKTFALFTEDIPEAILKVRKEFPEAPYLNQCFYLPDNDLLYVIEAEGPDRLSEILLGPII